MFCFSKMLCLRTDHTLNMICLNTFLTLKIYNGPVLDFSLIQHDADQCEILFLTHSEDNYTTYTLHVISYPSKFFYLEFFYFKYFLRFL